MKHKPILISGMVRSGTTWVGKTLALADSVNYFHEPFTYYARKKDARNPFFLDLELWEGRKFESDVKDYISNRVWFRPFSSFKEMILSESWKKSKHAIRCSLLILNGRRPIFKDPTALFSANWFSRNFDAEVIITVRHPAAVVNSMIAKNWTFDPKPFLRQEELVNTFPNSLKKQIKEYDPDKMDLIDQAILGWNIIYARVLIYLKQYPEWRILKHEDLSWSPVEEFRKLYNDLSLEFTKETEQLIIEHTQASTSSEFKRDSRTNITAWKSKLSEEDIERIKTGTNQIWPHFYSSNDW